MQENADTGDFVIFVKSIISSKDGLETQLGVNHLGHFLLSHLLRPSLKNAEGSRQVIKYGIFIKSFRIVYLTDLGYRHGQINFADLNSDESYDPSTAFNQVVLNSQFTPFRQEPLYLGQSVATIYQMQKQSLHLCDSHPFVCPSVSDHYCLNACI